MYCCFVGYKNSITGVVSTWYRLQYFGTYSIIIYIQLLKHFVLYALIYHFYFFSSFANFQRKYYLLYFYNSSSNQLLLLLGEEVGGEQPTIYSERTSGLCTDDGGRYIGTKADCDEGAGIPHVGWSDTDAELIEISIPGNDQPPGCYHYGSPSTGSLYFNNNKESSKPCGNSEKCLCKKMCEPGTYQDETGKTSCKDCAIGKFSIAGRSSCSTSCPKGKYVDTATVACVPCVIGKYNDVTSSETSCKNCPVGKYLDLKLEETGQVECKTCEAGKEATADQKACVVIGEQQSAKYFERTSGMCNDGADYDERKKKWITNQIQYLGMVKPPMNCDEKNSAYISLMYKHTGWADKKCIYQQRSQGGRMTFKEIDEVMAIVNNTSVDR